MKKERSQLLDVGGPLQNQYLLRVTRILRQRSTARAIREPHLQVTGTGTFAYLPFYDIGASMPTSPVGWYDQYFAWKGNERSRLQQRLMIVDMTIAAKVQEV